MNSKLLAKALHRWNVLKIIVQDCMQGNYCTLAAATSQAREICSNPHKRYVIFLVRGINTVNGGWLSIFSIAKETDAFFQIHRANVGMCTALGEFPLRKYTKFDNTAVLFPFRYFIKALPNCADVLIHVPEVCVDNFLVGRISVLRRTNVNWHFNILLQNIDGIPSPESVAALKKLGRVTATVAHEAYANDATAAKLTCPVHFLSTWTAPEEFTCTQYKQKDRLIVISPDIHPLKRRIVAKISAALPDHEVVEIRNMTFRQYCETIQRAKFVFTFGEGLDGYFVETIFSGGVAMAIYNDRFFTSDYLGLPGIFDNLAPPFQAIVDFMKAADDPVRHRQVWEKQFAKLSGKYVRREYLGRLQSFYERYFCLPGGDVVSE